MPNEPTNGQILEAVRELGGVVHELQGSFQHLESRFDSLEGRFGKLEGRFDGLEGRFSALEGRFDGLEGRFGGLEQEMHDTLEIVSFLKDHAASKEDVARLEARMVTKSYLEDKLADRDGAAMLLLRKEDAKVGALVRVLKTRKAISSEDAKQVLSMEPFPSR